MKPPADHLRNMGIAAGQAADHKGYLRTPGQERGPGNRPRPCLAGWTCAPYWAHGPGATIPTPEAHPRHLAKCPPAPLIPTPLRYCPRKPGYFSNSRIPSRPRFHLRLPGTTSPRPVSCFSARPWPPARTISSFEQTHSPAKATTRPRPRLGRPLRRRDAAPSPSATHLFAVSAATCSNSMSTRLSQRSCTTNSRTPHSRARRPDLFP
jgi:hypothetical protein